MIDFIYYGEIHRMIRSRLWNGIQNPNKNHLEEDPYSYFLKPAHTDFKSNIWVYIDNARFIKRLNKEMKYDIILCTI